MVIFDAESRYHVPTLANIMKHYVRRCCREQIKSVAGVTTAEPAKSLPETDIEEVVRNSLQHVHIFRPQSFESLLATLDSLLPYLFDSKAHPSAHRPLHSIILDSASSFLWQARDLEEDSRLQQAPGTGPSAGPASKPYGELVRRLRSLQSTLCCAVVATTWSLSLAQSTGPGSPPSLKTHLPPPWSSFPTLRLAVVRDAVPSFAPGMSIVKALGDRDARQKVVDEGKFTVSVNRVSSEEWDDRAMQAMGRRHAARSFGFSISSEGVLMGMPSTVEELGSD